MKSDPTESNPDNGKSIAKPIGKDPKTGQFLKGNRGGPGNPNARKVHDFRKVFQKCVSETDAAMVWKNLIEAARKKERWAIVELLDRLYGKAVQPIDASIIADTTTTITSLLLDDSTPRADMIARIISSRTATALPAQEQPAALPAPAEVQKTDQPADRQPASDK